MFNIARAQQVSHRQIVRFGRTPANPNALGKLRRGASDRNCTVAILEYKPHEKGLVLEGAMRALVSTVGLTVEPHHENDLLVAAGKVWRIVAPVGGPRPGGVAIFHDCQVVYQSVA
jgi:hypothetical protein